MALVVETIPSIGVTRLSRWIFNCYVIHDRGDGSVLVVDAGLPGAVDDLRAVLPTLGLALGAVTAVVATHSHSDHVAGVPALVEATGAAVHLPRPADDWVAGRSSPRSPGPSDIARIWPTVLDQPFDARGAAGLAAGSRTAGYGAGTGMRWPAALAFDVLGDGEPLPGAPTWTVLAAAGHTDDSVAFWQASTGTLLSGDAVLTVDGRAWITPEAVDPVARDETDRRLRSLPAVHVLPGHGRPVSSAGGDALARALGPGEGPSGASGASGAFRRAGRWLSGRG
ncbi:MAG TPA: MBL fold metallo-hydrolase [Acidimicrobiales bacterium]|nr:MBL fold metallo-hydrolase [Acidimicrobiales bacterium]